MKFFKEHPDDKNTLFEILLGASIVALVVFVIWNGYGDDTHTPTRGERECVRYVDNPLLYDQCLAAWDH